MTKQKSINRKTKTFAEALVFLIVLSAFVALSASASPGTTVSIGSVTDVPRGEERVVSIMINTDETRGIGSATIRLSYNKDVVSVESVSSTGDIGGVTANIQNEIGRTTMTTATGASPGPSGNVKFADVTLKALGSAGDLSDLDIDVKSLYDGTAGNPQPITPDAVNDGGFNLATVLLPLEAEAGGPYCGVVNQSITFMGSAIGGTPPYLYRWDLNNDGEYNDDTGVTASKTWSTAGTYTIGLQVTDSASPANVSTDTATVEISELVGALVFIPDASANISETATVPINIINVTDLGAATIWLSYNKNVVIVDEVADGNLGSITTGINNTAGVTKMSWFSATGKTGNFILVYVTLKAVNDTGQTSPLDLTIKSLIDTDAKTIVHTVDNGIITVSGPTPSPTPTPGGGNGGATTIPTPEETLTPAAEVTPTPTPFVVEETTPSPSPTPTTPPTSVPTPTPPGFEAVFAIAGLLAVAYLVLMRRKR